MSEEKSGIEKAREVANKLKEENKKEEESRAVAVREIKDLEINKELASMYQQASSVGSDNLGGELPALKVHSAGRSENELADGSEPEDGAFFYKPTGEQFKELRVHILTISKGFRAKGMADQKDKLIFNQLMAGVILSGGEMKPFVMYMTGLKLNPMWEFGKVAGKYTRQKPVGIPLFALTVKLTTEKVKNSYGKSWIVNFEIEKTESGSPVLVGDPTEFQYLLQAVGEMEEVIENVIHTKTANADPAPAVPAKVVEGQTVDPNTINAEDIPF